MSKETPDFVAILRALRKYQVDFIVVGGVAGVLHGAPISTFDLDVVHSREPRNIERLSKALEELQARYRTRSSRQLKPTASHLSSPGHQLLVTRAGPLDLLGVIGHGRSYESLVSQTSEMAVGKDLKVRVLNLEALIAVKEETAGEKDKAVLAVLKRTLEEKSRR